MIHPSGPTTHARAATAAVLLAMIDLRWLRENPEAFDAALRRRGMEPVATAVLAVDEERRALETRLQED